MGVEVESRIHFKDKRIIAVESLWHIISSWKIHTALQSLNTPCSCLALTQSYLKGLSRNLVGSCS